ncbi:MAG TPA: Trm112 family protein [Rhodanobacteraceae bacterium]|nr:Trm112 family protein [Rhodanobacteraceae bacterium]
MLDRRLLDILCCPVTKTPVRVLTQAELDALNRAIAAGNVRFESGTVLSMPATAGLITRDGRTIYRIEDEIPVMLADEGIATAQIADFPRA